MSAINVTVFGAGAWGTAVAMVLSSQHQVVLWGRDVGAMQAMAAQRKNQPYLPDIALPESITLTSDFDAALDHANQCGSLLISALPVAGLRPLLERLRTASIPNLIWLCKGFEKETSLLPHQVVAELLGEQIQTGVLSGPSFAQEVARGLPCALTIASQSNPLRQQVIAALHGGMIRIYSSDDVIGVEVGGAVKNILAIATGLADGLGLGLNARAALITRGLAEITRLGVALGGRAETFMGLTGMGDLILTCTGDLSRNRQVGLKLAQGKNLDTIINELGHVAEGVRCAQTVHSLGQQLGIEVPITSAIAGVLLDGNSIPETLASLLSRNPREELI